MDIPQLGPRYRVLEVLAEGGTGSVCRARDQSTGDEVALKVLYPEGAAAATAAGREFRLLASHSHPHLVRVFDFGRVAAPEPGAPDLAYFSMELVRGVRLDEFARRECPGGEPSAALRRVLRQILEALDYIHARGILHLDLKPANILVVGHEEPMAKLLDFGLAQDTTESARALAGTVEYLAPERLLEKGCDARSDLYSFGAMLFEVLTGECPFTGPDSAAVIDGHLHAWPPDAERLPESLRSTVLRLLEKDPTRRPRSARETLELLFGDSDVLDPGVVLGTEVVGRDALLEDVGRSPAPGERPRAHLVRGAVGSGKSRLLRELQIRLELRGVPTIHVRSSGVLSVAAGLLGATQSSLPPSVSQATRQRLAAVERRFDERTAALRPQGEAPESLLHHFADLFLDLAREVPLVLLVDEWEQADMLSREALLTLVRAGEYATDSALALVLATRDVSAADLDAVASFERATQSFRSATVHELGGLDRAAVEEYLASVLGGDEVSAELADDLLGRTGGNPYFLEELLQELLASGRLARKAHGWRLDAGAVREVELPSSIEEALLRRLERVAPEDRELLEWVAVLRHPVTVLELCSFLDRSPGRAQVEHRLEAFAREGLLVREGLLYEFPHASLAAVVYHALSDTQRAVRHDAVAARLLRERDLQGGGSAALKGDLAHHLESSSAPERAYPFLLEASAHARRGGAFRTAERDLERAVETSRTVPERFAALLELAAVRGLLGRKDEQQEVLQELADLSSRDDAEPLWPYQLAVARADRWESEGCYSEALGELETALACSDVASEQRHGLRVRMGLLQLHAGDFDDCARTFEHLHEETRTANDDSLQAECLQFLGLADYRRGRLEEAVQNLRAALALLRDLGAEAKLGAVTSNLGLVHLDRGDYAAAEEQFNASLVALRRVGLRRGESVNLLNLGLAALEMGRPERALSAMSEALAIRREVGDRRGEGSGMGNLAAVWIKLGRAERAVPLLEGALERARELGNRQSECVNECRLGLLEADRGHRESAASRLEHGLTLARELGLVAEQILALVSLARLLRGTPQAGIACEHALEAMRLSVESGLGALEITSRSAAARAHLDAGKLSRAAELSAEAVGALERFPGWLADAHLVWLEHHRILDACRAAASAGVLSAGGDGLEVPTEAACEGALRRAYSLLREKSDAFEDGELRDGFLANVPEHAEINRLHQALQARTRQDADRRERSFYEIARSIHSILELDPLLDRLLQLAIESTHAEKGLILLRTPEGDFTTRAARGMARESVEDASDICRSVISDVARGGDAVLATDAGSDARFRDRQSIISFQIRTLMCVPLVVRDEIIGAVYVDGRGAQSFGRADLDYLVSFARLAAIAVENVRLLESLRAENRGLRREVEQRYRFDNLIAESAVMQPVLEVMAKVARTSASVLVTGETGTGKEVVARAMHYASDRSSGPFVAVDCGALPENLLESELFGHRRGAFSGAVHHRVGLFEEADGGTLFLDEITNTSLDLQAKLLRVLQEGEVRRVGENQTRKVDVRVLAATNVPAREAVAAGDFREDLFYRLNVVSVEVPPLRERGEDVPLLAAHFLARSAERHGIDGGVELSPGAIRLLLELPWRGNVRELENLMEKAVILADTSPLSAAFVESLLSPATLAERRPGAHPATALSPSEPPPQRPTVPSASALPSASAASEAVFAAGSTLPTLESFDRDWREAERRYLLTLVEGADWNLSEAARRAQVRNRNTLISRLKKHGISRQHRGD